ncbi:sugar ABC transporter permease [Alicyclobacillus fastidiosus]|uniref:Sugar ABC transporter permease n=1 Tax=Alicyclobacillus fastidiosus TaxID=392011 RepID=A0ABY6ZAF1_9BACL|nr:sugar ABC transporter permease [Alicyclobacillus fastidiosus]WAH39804.1 sugar ABC transporter permease [Alicyclobacillus fastidiosus]GMA61059.1 spermidine/putrescine ABC transporter permease [Alicyclobacillus fastidiosus]
MKRGSGVESMERKWGIIFALPSILGFLIFALGPFLASFLLGLTKWQIGAKPQFIGLGNYHHMVSQDPVFWKSLWVTLYYSLLAVPIGMLLAFLIALLLNQKVRGLSLFRTIFYLPYVVPSVSSIMLWMWMFNPTYGLLNGFLKALGLPASQWIYSPSTTIPSLALMSIWQLGNTVIIYLAGRQGVPVHLYDAVEVDGGGAWSKLIHVTIPSMTPTILFNLVLSIIGTFQTFNQAYLMTQGGPNYASQFFVYNIFQYAFQYGDMGYACALSWILFIIIMILSVVVFRTSGRWVYYEGADAM